MDTSIDVLRSLKNNPVLTEIFRSYVMKRTLNLSLAEMEGFVLVGDAAVDSRLCKKISAQCQQTLGT